MSVKEWVPKFIDNSRIPVWLSRIAPIDIGAINIAFWVFSRGPVSPTTRRHETIHFQQQLELLLVGQWILYGFFWLIGLAIYRSGSKAYRQNPFEREARAHQLDITYLAKRRRYAWIHYVRYPRDVASG